MLFPKLWLVNFFIIRSSHTRKLTVKKEIRAKTVSNLQIGRDPCYRQWGVNIFGGAQTFYFYLLKKITIEWPERSEGKTLHTNKSEGFKNVHFRAFLIFKNNISLFLVLLIITYFIILKTCGEVWASHTPRSHSMCHHPRPNHSKGRFVKILSKNLKIYGLCKARTKILWNFQDKKWRISFLTNS